MILLAFILAARPLCCLIPKLSWQVESHLQELCEKWNRRDKSEIQQPCQHCSVNTWAVRHLGVLVTAVTHHCLVKLETQRNTNLDIAGYLYDIGHVKLTVAVCICKHLPVCIPNNGLFCGSTARTATETKESSCGSKFLSFLQYYLIIQICIYSLSSVTAGARWACINYGFSGRSSPGPEDMGNYSLCQWSRWTLVDMETCWWGHRAHNSPSQNTYTLTRSFLRPPSP